MSSMASTSTKPATSISSPQSKLPSENKVATTKTVDNNTHWTRGAAKRKIALMIAEEEAEAATVSKRVKSQPALKPKTATGRVSEQTRSSAPPRKSPTIKIPGAIISMLRKAHSSRRVTSPPSRSISSSSPSRSMTELFTSEEQNMVEALLAMTRDASDPEAKFHHYPIPNAKSTGGKNGTTTGVPVQNSAPPPLPLWTPLGDTAFIPAVGGSVQPPKPQSFFRDSSDDAAISAVSGAMQPAALSPLLPIWTFPSGTNTTTASTGGAVQPPPPSAHPMWTANSTLQHQVSNVDNAQERLALEEYDGEQEGTEEES